MLTLEPIHGNKVDGGDDEVGAFLRECDDVDRENNLMCDEILPRWPPSSFDTPSSRLSSEHAARLESSSLGTNFTTVFSTIGSTGPMEAPVLTPYEQLNNKTPGHTVHQLSGVEGVSRARKRKSEEAQLQTIKEHRPHASPETDD